MEETYLAWAMMSIGVAAVASGVVGFTLPEGQRLSVALALLLGAGVGLTILFAQGLVLGFEQQTGARSFLIASLSGFFTVAAALGVLVSRARRDATSPAVPAPPKP